VPLIIFHLKKKFLCKTEEEIKEAWAPGDLGFATRVPNDMLIVTIVLCYSVIAPLIIPFGVIYFGLGWLVAKNQVRYLRSFNVQLICNLVKVNQLCQMIFYCPQFRLLNPWATQIPEVVFLLSPNKQKNLYFKAV
jgi:Calcium-dependent channel, 7TM region, putative phosphate